MSCRPTLWKYSTLALAGALAFSWGGALLPLAQAAGPKRLTAALHALQASKKHLEDAKDPPVPLHNQSMKAVSDAITAVEKEIKAIDDAHEKKGHDKDRDHEKGEKSAKSADKSDKKDKDADAKPKKSSHSNDDDRE